MPFDSDGRPASAAQARLGGAHAAETPAVLACIGFLDALPTVCDHAAWLAARMGAGVELLSIEPAGEIARLRRRLRRGTDGRLLRLAADHLHEQGAEVAAACFASGPLVETVARSSHHACATVLSRRALGGPHPERLGAGLVRALDETAAPLCLASRFWLPVAGALVCHPPEPAGEAYSDWLATCPAFDGLAATFALLDPRRSERVVEQRPRPLTRGGAPAPSVAPPIAVGELVRRPAVDLIVAPRAAFAAGGALTGFGAAALATGLPLLAF